MRRQLDFLVNLGISHSERCQTNGTNSKLFAQFITFQHCPRGRHQPFSGQPVRRPLDHLANDNFSLLQFTFTVTALRTKKGFGQHESELDGFFTMSKSEIHKTLSTYPKHQHNRVVYSIERKFVRTSASEY
jgi:hypothetical protein